MLVSRTIELPLGSDPDLPDRTGEGGGDGSGQTITPFRRL